MGLRKTLWTANLAAALLLAYVAFSVAAEFSRAGPSGAAETPSIGGRVGAAPQPVTEQDCAAIMRRNIFGAALRAPVQGAEGRAPQPGGQAAAPLRLKLLGTVAGPSEVACALIEDQAAGKAEIYRVGETVQGARIEGIERQKVVLMRGFRRETLELHFSEARTAGPSDAAQAAAEVPPMHRPGSLTAGLMETEGRDLAADRRKLHARLRGNLEDLFRTAELDSYRPDGQMRGLSIVSVADPALEEKSRLQSGDVVLTINGRRITDREAAIEALEAARQEPVINIKLIRDGEERLFSIPTNY